MRWHHHAVGQHHCGAFLQLELGGIFISIVQSSLVSILKLGVKEKTPPEHGEEVVMPAFIIAKQHNIEH